MKKVLSLALVLLVLFSACSGGSENKDKPNESDKKVINVTYPDNVGYDEWMELAKTEFEKTYPELTVNYTKVSATEGDYNTKTSLMLQSDDSMDVMIVDSFLLPSLVASDSFAKLPVDTWDDWAQFPEAVKESLTYGDDVFAVLYSTDTRGMYYSVPLFEKAGIELPWEPKTWDDVLVAIQKLHDAEVAYPIWLNGSKAQGEATTMQTFEMLLAGTDDWLYQDGKWVVKSPGFLDSLKFEEANRLESKVDRTEEEDIKLQMLKDNYELCLDQMAVILDLLYGHVGIYIGDGKVADNIGYVNVSSLDDWIASYCKHSPVGFGFPPSVQN